jgi:hypothetical protein
VGKDEDLSVSGPAAGRGLWKGGLTVQLLPPHTLPAVPSVSFSVFHLAIPNIVAWVLVFAIVLVAAWIRLPKIFESGS